VFHVKQKNPHAKEMQAELFKAILRLKTAEECLAFFKDLCTPAELEAFADRWRVAQMLVEKKSYRAIAEETGVSVTTVTRVARFLNDGNGGYKAVIERTDT
jgi:TrpR-related protein YerC/YecD